MNMHMVHPPQISMPKFDYILYLFIAILFFSCGKNYQQL